MSALGFLKCRAQLLVRIVYGPVGVARTHTAPRVTNATPVYNILAQSYA